MNVTDNLANRIPNKNTKFQDYLQNPNKTELFLRETTPHDISILINELNINKSSDIYGISSKFIKLAKPILSHLLSIIFNKSIKEGTFPDAMKVAKLIPLFKNDSSYIVSNYRPISLLPIFCKIFEKLMHLRLTEFINDNNTLTKINLVSKKINPLN